MEEQNLLSLEAKRKKKQKSATKVIQMLELCRLHGGPVTPSTLAKLDELTDSQIVNEAKYLRAVQVGDIKLKKRKTDVATGKYTMVNIPIVKVKCDKRYHLSRKPQS